MLELDPKHESFNIFDDQITLDIWREKYAQPKEEHPTDTFWRVSHAIYKKDLPSHQEAAYTAMCKGLWMPGGRILASAGVETNATLMNCYVSKTIEDSMEGIMQALNEACQTLSKYGGIGMDFSTIRPKGALIKRTGLESPGIITWMKLWNAMSASIMQAGHRRGAMMGVIRDDHPDLPAFIKAKQTAGELTNFNVSVLVSDEFMQAVKNDAIWRLRFTVPPASGSTQSWADSKGVQWYTYEVVRARKLWEDITRSTYEFSEPGVIFIDRINEQNNLKYCETISCTNPCVTGETLILTDKGHLPINTLVGNRVNIWNGETFSDVIPFSTGLNSLMDITFSNGHTVRCTPYHKWALSDGRKVEAHQLVQGDKLLYVEMPILLEGCNYTGDAYSQGFYCGDGTKNAEESNLYKHGEDLRNRLVGKIWNRNCKAQPGYRWKHGKMLDKDFVPLAGNSSYCLNWLAGLFDADGCVERSGRNVVTLSAKNRDFLRRIGLMLNRLGVNYRIWERQDSGIKRGSNGKDYHCESTAALMLSHKSMYALCSMGLKCERLDLTVFSRPPNGIAKVGHRVVDIKHLPHKEETFCFNEPLKNMGVFNGVIGCNCGEQPLPPYGTCNLGAVNLARMVNDPFTSKATFNFKLLREVVSIGIRFLDNVIDVTHYPLEQQANEERQKRRLGLGVSGLADALAQLDIPYNSKAAIVWTNAVMQEIANCSYETSADLARERGNFPLYLPDILKGHFVSKLFKSVQDKLYSSGLRNGVLMTVAPTGTTSILFGNISSGIEPIFQHHTKRKVWIDNVNTKQYISRGFTARFLEHCRLDTYNMVGLSNLSKIFPTADMIDIESHVKMQGVCQDWVDASISKTINCPANISYEDFVKVYDLAYESGCKGCTTYRPSAVRGSVLEAVDAPSMTDLMVTPETITDEYMEKNPLPKFEAIVTGGEAPAIMASVGKDCPEVFVQPKSKKRPKVLLGCTYKISWPSLNANLYLTINECNGKPYEVFIKSKDLKLVEWTTVVSGMISRELRSGQDPMLIADDFKAIQGSHDGQWIEGKFYSSIIMYIGHILEEHFNRYKKIGLSDAPLSGEAKQPETYIASTVYQPIFDVNMACPKCLQPMHKEEGCEKCANCGYSKCG